MGERICSVDGCDRPHKSRGWCNAHYQRWKAQNSSSSRPRCAVNECERPALARGWCLMHYKRWRKYGDVSVVQTPWALTPRRLPPDRPERVCSSCETRPAVNAKGIPRCDECVSPGLRDHWLMRSCRDCDAEFRTNNHSTRCNACAYQRSRRNECVDCLTKIDKRSKRCTSCVAAWQVGENTPNWRGGRTRHKYHGYVRVKTPDHPRAASDGYVREHILVMEESLGRYLEPDEHVHHRNGIRDDNRIENLELWVHAHPSGQRVTDLVAFARDVLARYGKEATP